MATMSTVSKCVALPPRQTVATPRRGAAARARWARFALAAVLWQAAAAPAGNAPNLPDPALAALLRQAVEQRARAAWTGSPPLQVKVTLGRIDPQLQLAPCGLVEPFFQPGLPAWGQTRVGLRCADGVTAWKVSLPVSVQITVQALIAMVPLPAGQTIQTRQLASGEVDAASAPDLLPPEPALAVGRQLGRSLAAGEPLRRSHLRQRQWFAAGDSVAIVAAGAGWTVTAQGRALSAGLEGQTASARTESGRVVSGYPTSDHRLEVAL